MNWRLKRGSILKWTNLFLYRYLCHSIHPPDLSAGLFLSWRKGEVARGKNVHPQLIREEEELLYQLEESFEGQQYKDPSKNIEESLCIKVVEEHDTKVHARHKNSYSLEWQNRF